MMRAAYVVRHWLESEGRWSYYAGPELGDEPDSETPEGATQFLTRRDAQELVAWMRAVLDALGEDVDDWRPEVCEVPGVPVEDLEA